MSNIKVNSISSVNGSDPVNFPTGISGSGANLTFEPKVIQFSPTPLSTGVGISTNIVITFDQTIQFSGVGTIRIREGSATGTITESFTCGVSAGATIAGQTLIIDPTSNLSVGTTYYVTLPSVGIANTLGQYYKGTSSYLFQTAAQTFTMTGGTYEYVVQSPSSPTGYYKYHIFSGSGPLVLDNPSTQATDFQFMLVGSGGNSRSISYPQGGVAAGGGAGGVITRTGPTLALPSGSYTITVGAVSPTSPYGTGSGNPSKLSPPSPPAPVILEAFGGGGSGRSPFQPSFTSGPGGSGGGAGFMFNLTHTDTGGTGTPGQGNPGAAAYPVSTPPTIPAPTAAYYSGGGGGAGGAASLSNAGPGIAVTAFAAPFLSGYIPSPVLPIESLSAIGPTGLYGGGGGGVASNPPTGNGSAGPGGGGGGTRFYPIPTPSFPQGPGLNLTGGGAGAGPGGGGGYSGGSGVAMIRYATPAPA